jgi:hypothetical protein
MPATRSTTGTHILLVLTACLLAPFSYAAGGDRVMVYGVRMIPFGDDATTYSRAGYGAGGQIVIPVPALLDIFAGVGGIEYVNLLSKTVSFRDYQTGLRVDQETSQGNLRLYIGGQVGGHGNGFLRPHAGGNLSVTYCSFVIDVVVPDDYNREQEIRQNLRNEGRWVLGYDMTFGLDLNFKTFSADGGVRYVKSFSVPEQLGDGSVHIYPNYFQVYIGVGIPISL